MPGPRSGYSPVVISRSTAAVVILCLGLASGSFNWWGRAAGSSSFKQHGENHPAIAAEMAADWVWLKLNRAWEIRDRDAARGLIGLAVRLAPHDGYFRINGARMLAYDLPAWRAQSEPDAPAAIKQQWRVRGGSEAIAFLFAADGVNTDSLIEAGNIARYALEDLSLATRYFGSAAMMPDAQPYVVRIYLNLLENQGRRPDAINWLRARLQRLPSDTPSEQRDWMILRQQELESRERLSGEAL